MPRRRRKTDAIASSIAPLLLFLLPSLASAASAPSEFRTGEFVPTARRVQYHGTRSRWVDLASGHCPRFGADGVLAIPLPAPAVPPTKGQRTKSVDGSPPFDLRGTYKVQFAFDGERVLTPWLTVAREDGGGDDGDVVAPVPVVDLVLSRAGRELLGGGATRAEVSLAPQDYVAAHGGLADEWRSRRREANGSESGQRWPRTLPVRVRWAAKPGADLAAGATALLAASLVAAVAASVASLAGHGRVIRELVEGTVAAGADEAEAMARRRRATAAATGGGGGGSVQLSSTRQQQQQHQPAAPAAFGGYGTQPSYQQQRRPPSASFAPPSVPVPAPAAAPTTAIAPPPPSLTPQQQYAYFQQQYQQQQRQQQQPAAAAPFYPSSFQPRKNE